MRKLTGLFFVLVLIGATLPSFVPQPVQGMTGSGTQADPYMIYDVGDLQDMNLDPTAFYELANDIDASGTMAWNYDVGRGVYEGFLPINSFSGSFNGNFYMISDLYMDWYGGGYRSFGLFGALASNARIHNVIVANASITGFWQSADGTAGSAGVLVGSMYSISNINITQCWVSGVVDNTFNDYSGPGHTLGAAGGLIGRIYNSYGAVTSCASHADVEMYAVDEAVGHAGGFIGHYQAGNLTIRDCYAMGDVYVGYDYLGRSGGFCGTYVAGGQVDNVYSTGAVLGGTSGGLVGSVTGGCEYITDSFWDEETSGLGVSACGTGETTSNMQTQSTFTDAGWDFTNIWAIGGAINYGYPYLLWWYDPGGILDSLTQVVWFQPNYIIQGTDLPNRTGQTDGVIHWGANPPGISIDMEPFEPDDDVGDYDIGGTGLDMVGPTGNPDWTGDPDTLVDHPFYPLVDAIGDQTGIPNHLLWIIGATLLLLLAMLVTYRYTPHQIITAIVGGSLASFWYAMGIYPFWVIFVFVIMALAIIIGERSPTV